MSTELGLNPRNVPLKWETDGRVDLYTPSLTQIYVPGTKHWARGNRRFRYGFVGTGGLQSEFGCCYPLKTIPNRVLAVQANGGSASAGSRLLTITIGAAASDGIAGNGAIALDELIGGYITIGNGGNQHPQNRLLLGNTVNAAGATSCTVLLDYPLDTAVTPGTTNIEVLMNPYRYLTSGNVTNSDYVAFMGMPAVTCSAGYWTWIQDRGPCWGTNNNATCNSAGDRSIYFVSNGSWVSGDDESTTDNTRQLAGFAIDMSGSGAQNAPFLDLMIGS
jgi:hypothetical protein